jgi:hypothetical protein
MQRTRPRRLRQLALAPCPTRSPGGIRQRYDDVLELAFAHFPRCRLPGAATGAWTNAERDAWNPATRLRRHEDQTLRLLVDTRVPFTNNEAERSVRMCKLSARSPETSAAPLTPRRSSRAELPANRGQAWPPGLGAAHPSLDPTRCLATQRGGSGHGLSSYLE